MEHIDQEPRTRTDWVDHHAGPIVVLDHISAEVAYEDQGWDGATVIAHPQGHDITFRYRVLEGWKGIGRPEGPISGSLAHYNSYCL
jgi:hypothetical protein